MTVRRQDENSIQPERLAHSAYRPSPRLALRISLGVHALFVLMLFHMYTEYVGQPEPKLHIVARATAPNAAATPSFATSPLPDTEVPEEVTRPAARVESLPQQATSFADGNITPLPNVIHGPRRVTAPAALPSTSVNVPAELGVPLETDVVAVSAAPARAFLNRTDTLQVPPLRIASRPIYGPRPERPLGFAALPAVRGEDRQREPAAAFAHRHLSARTPPENQSAIHCGLEFLARMQLDDGRWQFSKLRGELDPQAEPASARSDAAATGLALLAFFGAGHDHFDSRFRIVIQDGLDFLVRVQQHRGEFFDDDGAASGKITRFYSHGIATLALCEAYGMTGDGRLRAPAQRALDHLAGKLESETLARRDLPSATNESSVIGWQLATLRSGQLAGLTVDPEALARITDNFAISQNQLPPIASQPDAVSTAVGLAVELHLGGARNEERLRPAADALLAHPPEVDALPTATTTAAIDDSRRDTYYWYFGSQAMYYLGGEDWQSWSRQLYPRLIKSQVAEGPLAGSWQPPIVAANQRADVSTRLYVSAMNLLSLETEQRLPPARSAARPRVADQPQN